MKNKGMSATLLEKILILIVILIFGCTIAAYYFLSNFAKTQAKSANHSMLTAQSTQKDIDSLQKSYKWIEKHPEVVDKTNKIVADASQYQYQDQIIKDLELYAKQSGNLVVSQYTFSEPSGTQTAPTGGGAAKPATPAPAAAGSTSTSAQLPQGLTATTVDITFPQKGVPYDKILLFVKKIEQNVTRMQITALSITPDPTNRNSVIVTMTISVFLNKGA
jgi:type II secretory pathway pseudopilin PulG